MSRPRMVLSPKQIIARVMARTRAGEAGCRLWIGDTSSHGYPRIYYGGEKQSRRWFFELLTGATVPEGKLVHASCGHRHCIAPDHLGATTLRALMRQRVPAKRADIVIRMTMARRRRAKLTIEQAREIRRRGLAGESTRILGPEFGIAPRYARAIVRGDYWREPSPFGG